MRLFQAFVLCNVVVCQFPSNPSFYYSAQTATPADAAPHPLPYIYYSASQALMGSSSVTSLPPVPFQPQSYPYPQSQQYSYPAQPQTQYSYPQAQSQYTQSFTSPQQQSQQVTYRSSQQPQPQSPQLPFQQQSQVPYQQSQVPYQQSQQVPYQQSQQPMNQQPQVPYQPQQPQQVPYQPQPQPATYQPAQPQQPATYQPAQPQSPIQPQPQTYQGQQTQVPYSAPQPQSPVQPQQPVPYQQQQPVPYQSQQPQQQQLPSQGTQPQPRVPYQSQQAQTQQAVPYQPPQTQQAVPYQPQQPQQAVPYQPQQPQQPISYSAQPQSPTQPQQAVPYQPQQPQQTPQKVFVQPPGQPQPQQLPQQPPAPTTPMYFQPGVRVPIPTSGSRSNGTVMNVTACIKCACTFAPYCCNSEWTSYCDGATATVCFELCAGTAWSSNTPLITSIRSYPAAEGEFCGRGVFLRPVECGTGLDCLSTANTDAAARDVGMCVKNSAGLPSAVTNTACNDATPRCRCTTDRCPERGWSTHQGQCLLGERSSTTDLTPCSMTPQLCPQSKTPCNCAFSSCWGWSGQSPRQCARAPAVMQCSRTLSGMADAAIKKFQQRGIEAICWDFDNTIVFLNTPQGTYPDLSYILERVNPDFVLLAKTAAKAGFYQAITTYNEFGMLFMDGGLSGGPRLLREVLLTIFGNQSNFVLAAFNVKDHMTEGKNNHLAAVKDKFAIQRKSSVMLIDDSSVNVNLAKQDGWSAIRASSGRGFELRLVLNG